MTSPTPLRYDVWPTVIANLDMYLRFELFQRCPAVRRTESSCPAKIDNLELNLTSITMGKTSFRLAPRYRLIIVSGNKTRNLEFKTRPSSEFEALKRMAIKLLGRYSKPVIVGILTIDLGVALENAYLPPTLKISSRRLNQRSSTFGTNSDHFLDDIRRLLTPNSFPLENLKLDAAIEWIEDPIIATAKNLKLECDPWTIYEMKNQQVHAVLSFPSLFNPITLIEVWRTEQAKVGRHFRLDGFTFNETRRVLDVVKGFPGVVSETREDDSECLVFPECFTLVINDDKKLHVFGKQHSGFIEYEIHFKIV